MIEEEKNGRNGGYPPGGAAEADAARAKLEAALFEIKRVIVGQEEMLERVFVALLTGGHILIEGVPGLAKTMTVRAVADVLGGDFSRVQFTPDLVPADLIGTRVYRPDSGTFGTELGPVICNFLLADEINRAPAKVQSALLEVMQEGQVTIGQNAHRVPEPFLVMATQNPIESEGTYPLPEAQLDRFLMKVLVGYPSFEEETTVVRWSLDDTPKLRRILTPEDVLACGQLASRVFVDRLVVDYAVDLASATRSPAGYGLPDLAPYVEFGASPRGSINLVRAARAAALLRGRDYVLPGDVTVLARDVLRHRLVLAYRALAEEVSADDILDEILAVVPAPHIELAEEAGA